jgi:hypothetical protein
VVFQYFGYELYSSVGRYFGKADKPAVRSSFEKNELTEILVHCHQHTVFSRSPTQDNLIARIRTSVPGFNDVMSLLTQPVSQTVAGAPVHEELQLPVTPTASRES